MSIYKYIKKYKFILLLILIIIIVFFIINKLCIIDTSYFIDYNEFNNNNKILIIGNFHSKNESGLQKMLEYLKLEHKFSNINDINNDIDKYNIIYSPNQPIDSSLYPNKKFIFGPHFSVFPEDSSLSLINNKFNNSIYIQPSEWAAKAWINKISKTYLPIKIFPFPVNTEKFKPLDNIDNRNNTHNTHNTHNNIFIYFKRRKPEELEYLETFLKNQNINYKIFDYIKKYEETDYLNYLQTCKYGIILGAHESQGFAIQEALSSNIPLLIWSASSMNQEHGSNFEDIPCISVPYWDNRCGEIFYKDVDLEKTFNKFIVNLHNYKPREYILENLSTVKCSERFIDLIKSITINTNIIEKFTLNTSTNFPMTCVSGFWKVKNKINKDYFMFFTNTLAINCPYVFFTANENIEKIKNYRKNYLTYFIEKNIEDFKTYKLNIKNEINALNVTSKELGLIWLEKMNLVLEASIINPYKSEWFCWIDAAIPIYRDTQPSQLPFPNPDKINLLSKTQINYCTSENIDNLQLNKIKKWEYVHNISGTFIIHISIINKIHNLFYKYLDICISETTKYTCYSDQCILTRIYVDYPELFNKIGNTYGQIILDLT